MEKNDYGMADCHTHCRHSHDSDCDPKVMLEAAMDKGADYYAFTDHDDRDYYFTLPEYGEMRQLNVKEHVREILALRSEYAGKIYAGLGIELSYEPRAIDMYIEDLAETDEWDIILNSVHTVLGHDIYYKSYFDEFGREKAFINYLDAVNGSLDVPYAFDVVGHFGYVSRKAPYGDKNALAISEFGDRIDAILKKIIDKGVSLEINTHSRAGTDFLPDCEIIDRYIELGGRDFTFGSDTHQVCRVLDKFDTVCDFLKSKDIHYLNSYRKRIKTPLKIK